MSKKLIAIASAAALGLSALVGIAPANALPVVTADAGTSFLKVTGVSSGGAGTSASAFVDRVPEAGTVTSADILTFTVSSTLKRTAASVTATSGIKLLDAPGDATNKYTSASGSASLSLTTTDTGSLLFYGFATTTTMGVVTLTIGTDITQVYITGEAGAAYAIKSVTPPTSVAPEAKGTFVAVLTDAFGNTVITGELAVTAVGGGTGTAFADELAASNKITYSSTTKRHAGILTAGKTAGQIAVSAQLAGEATDAQIAAFGTPVRTYFTVITTASVTAQVAALTKQVTDLQAQLAALTASTVTKAKYNKLVRKWNRANPSNKVKRVS
jgi:hypothetical protein